MLLYHKTDVNIVAAGFEINDILIKTEAVSPICQHTDTIKR